MNIGSEEHRLACHSISISGLSTSDRSRIEEVGFSAWLEEAGDENTSRAAKNFNIHVRSNRTTPNPENLCRL